MAASILPLSGDSWLLPLLIALAWFAVANVTLRPAKFFLRDGRS